MKVGLLLHLGAGGSSNKIDRCASVRRAWFWRINWFFRSGVYTLQVFVATVLGPMTLGSGHSGDEHKSGG